MTVVQFPSLFYRKSIYYCIFFILHTQTCIYLYNVSKFLFESGKQVVVCSIQQHHISQKNLIILKGKVEIICKAITSLLIRGENSFEIRGHLYKRMNERRQYCIPICQGKKTSKKNFCGCTRAATVETSSNAKFSCMENLSKRKRFSLLN